MDSKNKREKMIKEIKSIYSSRIKAVNPVVTTPEIASVNPLATVSVGKKLTFFNSVIDKLNIEVRDK